MKNLKDNKGNIVLILNKKKVMCMGILIFSVLCKMGSERAILINGIRQPEVSDVQFSHLELCVSDLYKDCDFHPILTSAPIAEEVGFMRPFRKGHVVKLQSNSDVVLNPYTMNEKTIDRGNKWQTDTKEYSTSLESRCVVDAGKSVTLKACGVITLKPGFHARAGSIFQASTLP